MKKRVVAIILTICMLSCIGVSSIAEELPQETVVENIEQVIIPEEEQLASSEVSPVEEPAAKEEKQEVMHATLSSELTVTVAVEEVPSDNEETAHDDKATEEPAPEKAEEKKEEAPAEQPAAETQNVTEEKKQPAEEKKEEAPAEKPAAEEVKEDVSAEHPVEEKPAEEPAREEVPAEQPVEEKPAEEPAEEEVPTEQSAEEVKEEVPAEQPVEEQQTEEVPEVPSEDETPTEEQPVEDPPAEESEEDAEEEEAEEEVFKPYYASIKAGKPLYSKSALKEKNLYGTLNGNAVVCVFEQKKNATGIAIFDGKKVQKLWTKTKYLKMLNENESKIWEAKSSLPGRFDGHPLPAISIKLATHEETPAEEIIIEETPTEEASVEAETPVEELPAENATEEATAEESPAEEAIEDAHTEEIPAEEVAGEVLADAIPVEEEIPAEEVPGEEKITTEENPTDEEASVEEIPVDEATEEDPAEEITAEEEVSGEETPVEETVEEVLTEMEEKPELNLSVDFVSDHEGMIVEEGELITLTAILTGFEGINYSIQWQYTPDGGQTIIDAEGADQTVFSYVVTSENAGYLWRVNVNYDIEE